ncbi:MAG: IgA Peptidase M64 [Prevotellaceae bacterium]|nr:IgA Peptidase M64 [Prevotellaceae bacterium]
MKSYLLFVLCLLASMTGYAQEFDAHFENRTLRLDYIFSGDAAHQSVCLSEMSVLPSWAGRRHRLGELPLSGNGQITVRDVRNHQTLYVTSFSSLFQEWIATEEAKTKQRGFENSFLVPFPLHPVEIEIALYNARHEVTVRLAQTVDPKDILIHRRGLSHITPHRYLQQNGTPEKCIDIAILAEGYKPEEAGVFYQDAERAVASLFDYTPFKENRSRFNVVAVMSPSVDSNVSIPKEGVWRQTAFGSHFSTFYSDRYLTTQQVFAVHNALAGIDYEHIIILANSEEYGGGGIYHSYTLSTAHHPTFKEVIVHEFGHAFGGLADEYFYEDDFNSDTYPTDVEPWEPNITTLVDFDAKWKDLLNPGTPVPTPVSEKAKHPVGVYEGGGYSFKGVYRPADECRMRNNTYPTFCPVCERGIGRIIDFYTE